MQVLEWRCETQLADVLAIVLRIGHHAPFAIEHLHVGIGRRTEPLGEDFDRIDLSLFGGKGIVVDIFDRAELAADGHGDRQPLGSAGESFGSCSRISGRLLARISLVFDRPAAVLTPTAAAIEATKYRADHVHLRQAAASWRPRVERRKAE